MKTINTKRTSIWQLLYQNRKLKILNLIIGLALTTSCGTSLAQTLDTSKLNQFFDRLNENNEAMGSLTITKNGEVIYARSIGYSRIGETEKAPITSETRHRVGSVTKMFTAVMILQLAEEGKLKLNDRLNQYFPQIPNADRITIEHILRHRSGIHDITTNPALRPRRRTVAITKDEMLQLISKGGTDFDPGSKYAYSNSGYFVLGLLIEKVSNQSYQEAIEKRILAKIDLKSTYPAHENISPNKKESFSYVRLSDWKQQPQTHWSILFGSGSLVSTPDDLAKFIQALYDLKFISQESLNQMTSVQDGYGLGIDTFEFAEKNFFGHTGGIDGFGSWLAYLPEEKLTISYTTNAKVYPVAKIMSAVADIYFNRHFEIPSFEAVSVSPKALDQYSGVYVRQGAPVKFTVSHDSTTLFISVNGSPRLSLEATSENTFKLESQGMILEFKTQSKEMVIRRAGGVRVFTKEN